jgi:hypothetical protein
MLLVAGGAAAMFDGACYKEKVELLQSPATGPTCRCRRCSDCWPVATAATCRWRALMRRLMARATRGWQSCCNLWPEVLHAAGGTAARVDHRRYKGRQRCYDFGPAVLYAARSAAASGAARQVAGDGCGAERMASEDRGEVWWRPEMRAGRSAFEAGDGG